MDVQVDVAHGTVKVLYNLGDIPAVIDCIVMTKTDYDLYGDLEWPMPLRQLLDSPYWEPLENQAEMDAYWEKSIEVAPLFPNEEDGWDGECVVQF